MRSGGDTATSPSHARRAIGNANTRNSTGNSGSQYALCALGVGLIALGIVMIVWSAVPANVATNSSISEEDSSTESRKNKASSVAFVLVGSGVVMLLLSLCVGMRNKQREQQYLQDTQNNGRVPDPEQPEGETAEEQAQRYAVPSYEEAVGSGQYPVTESNHQPGTFHLPSYDDLVEGDGVRLEHEGTDPTSGGPNSPAPAPSGPTPAAAAAAAATAPAPASNRKPGKNSRKLLSLKIRRIKSEKLHIKNVDNSQPDAGISIEPLTPPPQYEEKEPPL